MKRDEDKLLELMAQNKELAKFIELQESREGLPVEERFEALLHDYSELLGKSVAQEQIINDYDQLLNEMSAHRQALIATNIFYKSPEARLENAIRVQEIGVWIDKYHEIIGG